LAIEVAASIDALRVIAVLERLFAQYGTPAVLRSDNGPEFIARALRIWALMNHSEIVTIEPGKPWQNGSSESLNGTLRSECLDREWFANLREAKIVIEQWRWEYNTQRPHSSLGYRTPAEVGTEARAAMTRGVGGGRDRRSWGNCGSRFQERRSRSSPHHAGEPVIAAGPKKGVTPPLHVLGSRSQPDPRLRSLHRPAAPCGVRRRHAEMAHGKTLHVMVESGAGQQDLRPGKAKAVTATARKLAVLFYNALRYGMSYADAGADYYEERYRQRVVHNLQRRARQMGFTLVEDTGATAGVS
jgi:hypothetical protein